MIMMFLSPIFFPMEVVPAQYRPWMYINPTTTIILQLREVAIAGHLPDFQALGIYTIVGLIVMSIGYWAFARTRKGFADVL